MEYIGKPSMKSQFTFNCELGLLTVATGAAVMLSAQYSTHDVSKNLNFMYLYGFS